MGGDSKYRIRQARVSDWPRIDAFIARTYGASAPFKRLARWEWQFRNTPYGDPADEAVPIWLALHDGEVVGQIALQPGQLWLDGEAIPMGWIVDVMVDPHHRGQRLSHRINEAIVATGRTLVTLTMAPATRRIMDRAGCVTLPEVHQMVRVGRLSGGTVSALLRRISANRPSWRRPVAFFIRSGIGPILAAAGLSAAARVRRIGNGDGRGKGGILRDDALPDAQALDALEIGRLARARACFDRGSAFFFWRFRAVPDLDYRFAELAGERCLRAVLIWRLPMAVELPVGTIADVLCDPHDTAAMGACIDHALAKMRGCEAVIAGASDPRSIREYTARGFVTVKKHHPTVVSTDHALLARIAGHPGPWHFSKADHDWDQIHPA